MDISKRGKLFTHYLGQETKEAVARAGISSRKLAPLINSQSSQLSLYYNGKRDIPAPILSAICDVIKVDPKELVDAAYKRLIATQGVYIPEEKEQYLPKNNTAVSSEPDLTKLNLATKETDYDPWNDVERGEEYPRFYPIGLTRKPL